jgi:hypothetical protein
MGKRRGHIEEVGGKFRGVASAGRDPLTGKRRQPKTELFAIETDAEAALAELHRQIDEDRLPKNKILVSALIEKWFDVVELEESTRERYEGLNRRYIQPAFGSVQFAKLDPEELEAFYSRLRRCTHLCDPRRRNSHTCEPLSSSSVRQIHAVLTGAGQRGVRWKYFGVNPAELARRPQRREHLTRRTPQKRPRSSTRRGERQRGEPCSGRSWSQAAAVASYAPCVGLTSTWSEERSRLTLRSPASSRRNRPRVSRIAASR